MTERDEGVNFRSIHEFTTYSKRFTVSRTDTGILLNVSHLNSLSS